MPYFPPDIYGFSTQDRLHWGMDGINYLLNNADISYLGNLKFSDGTPLFTEPELSSHARCQSGSAKLFEISGTS